MYNFFYLGTNVTNQFSALFKAPLVSFFVRFSFFIDMTFSTSHHFKFSGNNNSDNFNISLTHCTVVKGKIESLKTFRVEAKEGTSGQDMQLQYSHQKVIGHGSFGIVYQVKLSNGEDAAIKKVPQDKRYKVNNYCVVVL